MRGFVGRERREFLALAALVVCRGAQWSLQASIKALESLEGTKKE